MRIDTILVIFVISGCSALNYDRPRRNHSLSKAIETGSSGGTSRVDNTNRDRVTPIVIGSDEEEDPSKNSEFKIPNEENEIGDSPTFFSFEVTRSTNIGEHIDDLSRYSFIAGIREEQNSLLFHAAITDYDFNKDWQYSSDLDDPWAIEAGIAFQRYFIARENFIQPFIKVGIAYGGMYWSYNDSIYETTTGEKIDIDWCEYLRPSVAVGMEFKLTDTLNISVDLQQDYTSYIEITGQGFDNDILSNYWTTMFSFRLIWHY